MQNENNSSTAHREPAVPGPLTVLISGRSQSGFLFNLSSLDFEDTGIYGVSFFLHASFPKASLDAER